MRKKQKNNKDQKSTKSFSKVAIVIMIIFCLQIVIYSEIAMWILQDLSNLYALIGIAASLAAALVAYFQKSAKENCEGGITYDMAMMEEDNCDDDADNCEEFNESEAEG